MNKTFLADNGNAKPETGDHRPEAGNRRLQGVTEKKNGALSEKLSSTLHILVMAFLAATMYFFTTGCEENEGDGDDRTVTYTGTASETDYTLKISQRSDEPREGDKYTLTASSKTSSGNVVSFDGANFTLKPSNSTTTFNASVSGDELTNISGMITWRDNSSSQGPGSFLPTLDNDPNLMESNRLLTGTIVYQLGGGVKHREVFDEGSKRYAETVIHPDGVWITDSYTCGGNYYLWSSLDHGGPYYQECNNLPCDCGRNPCGWNYLSCFHRGFSNVYVMRRIADQTIAGVTCSVWTDGYFEQAIYRGIIFKQVYNGVTSRVVESFTESVTGSDFEPPEGYSIDPGWDKKEFCEWY